MTPTHLLPHPPIPLAFSALHRPPCQPRLQTGLPFWRRLPNRPPRPAPLNLPTPAVHSLLPVLLPFLLQLLLSPAALAAPAGPNAALIAKLSDPSDTVRLDAARALATSDDPQAVEPLVERLRNDPIPDVRVAAAQALALLHDRRATPALCEALHSTTLDLRVAAAHALGVLADPQAVEPLATAACDDDITLRRQATLALGEIGAPAIPILARRLQAGPAVQRAQAAAALGATEKPAVLPALLAHLADDDPAVRSALAKALAAVAAANPTDPALAALPEKLSAALAAAEWTTRHAALLTLIERPGLLPPKAIIPLLDDPNLQVRTTAGFALERLGRSALTPLIKQLADKNPALRRQAALVLGHTRDRRAVKPLLPQLADPDAGARAAAVEAIGRIAEPESSGKLLDLLADPVPAVQAAARVALRQTAPHTFEQVVAGLSDTRQPVRLGCVLVLRELRDRRGIPALIPATEDPDEPVRFAAVQTLGVIGVYSIPVESAILRRLDSSKPDTPRIRAAAAEALRQVRANK